MQKKKHFHPHFVEGQPVKGNVHYRLMTRLDIARFMYLSPYIPSCVQCHGNKAGLLRCSELFSLWNIGLLSLSEAEKKHVGIYMQKNSGNYSIVLGQ